MLAIIMPALLLYLIKMVFLTSYLVKTSLMIKVKQAYQHVRAWKAPEQLQVKTQSHTQMRKPKHLICNWLYQVWQI